MVTKATPVTEAEKDEPNVQGVLINVPGVDGPIRGYVRVEQVDDLTGKPTEGIETVRLMVPLKVEKRAESPSDKTETIEYEEFEIDLSPASFDRLTNVLEPFKAKARAVERKPVTTSSTAKRSVSKSSNPARTLWTQRARTWLEANRPKTGVKTTDRGRLKEDHQELYLAFNPDDPRP